MFPSHSRRAGPPRSGLAVLFPRDAWRGRPQSATVRLSVAPREPPMRSMPLRRPAVALLVLCGFAVAGDLPDSVEYVRLHYDKREVRIPMRDGVKLFTSIYTPKDTTRSYPILMRRTPYSAGPYGPNEYRESLGPSMHFTHERYIFVYQDVRGRYLSEGDYVHVTPHLVEKSAARPFDESSDTRDTIDWLLANIDGHTGKVGMWGISYPGFYAAAGMIDHHPALVASSPQAPVANWFFDDFLHHGAFFLAHAFRWLAQNAKERTGPTTDQSSPFDYPTQDGYRFFLEMGPMVEADRQHFRGNVKFWNEFVKHPTYDEFWQEKNILPHMKDVAPNVMVVTGWYDAEDLYGSFHMYQSIEEKNPKVNNVLVVGPWAHGGWARTGGDHLGAVHFGSDTAEFYREHIELPFFNKYLKNKDGLSPPAEATCFETGGNQWRTFGDWPPAATEARTLHFGPGGQLSFEPTDAADAVDEFVSDPAHPVPYTETVTPLMTREYMTDDQRFAGRRPDVLVYQTPLLEEDVVLAGPLTASLKVSTDQGDADWVVKLIDVHPDDEPDNRYTPPLQSMGGYQEMVRSEVIRGRYREDFSKPKAFVPDQPTDVEFPLQDVLHRFGKGHRITVQVQSTWFPLVDRNPQKWVENVFAAGADDFVKANHRLHLNGTTLKVGVLPDATVE